MSKLILQLEQAGEDLIVRIPREVASAAALEAGQSIKLVLPQPSLSLEQKLELYDPAKYGEEIGAVPLEGREIVK